MTLPPRQDCLAPLAVLEQYLTHVRRLKGDEAIQKLTEEGQAELLRVSDFLFGSILEGALTILDECASKVTKIVSKASNRSLFVVKGSQSQSNNGGHYICLLPEHSDGIYYCACPSFLERSRTSSCLLCKHLLAIKLMPALGCHEQVLEANTDEDFATMITSRLTLG